MNLLLVFIFFCVGQGLLLRRLGAGASLALAALATAMAALYFFSGRFM